MPKPPKSGNEIQEPRDIATYTFLVHHLMHEARRTFSPCSFVNKGPKHAHVVVSTMIDNAEKEICIFATEMSRDVYDASKIKEFLKRNSEGKVRVIIEHKNAPKSPQSALSELTHEIRTKRIDVKIINTNDITNIDGHNFCLVDGIHVRFEEDQSSREATFFFADKEIGKAAADRFAVLDSFATEYVP